MSTLTAFWAPALPVARIVWLRRLVYLFVLVDVLVFVTDPVPHGDVPSALYRPLLVRQVLHLPQPSHLYVRLLLAVLVLSAAVAATGRLPRVAGWTCALAMLDWMSNGMSYSKIDHDHFAFVLALFVLPTVRAARSSDHSLDQGAGWAIRLIQMGAVASYFLAFWAKMRFGGWGWASGATLVWALTRRPHGIAPWLGQQALLTHAMQWTVLVLEACSPLMLWLRGRPLYAYMLFWLCFHASTYYLLAISFLPLVICLFAFLPLERLGTPARQDITPARRRRSAAACPPAAAEAPWSAR